MLSAVRGKARRVPLLQRASRRWRYTYYDYTPFYKGVKALACARVAGHYWRRRGGGGKLIARLLQSEGSDMFGVDIHPGE